ncbi:hypothetical protein AB0K80_21765 [Streptomyces sp. NPDC052682]|uniref:hypothetical protein n=1 Tax=Streptomyces sp. NPDC052682 TaxID=3154954 RepID=UPI0034232BBF
MPATEHETRPHPFAVAGLSMRDLLASCAAARTISTPPCEPDPDTTPLPVEEHGREAA